MTCDEPDVLLVLVETSAGFLALLAILQTVSEHTTRYERFIALQFLVLLRSCLIVFAYSMFPVAVALRENAPYWLVWASPPCA